MRTPSCRLLAGQLPPKLTGTLTPDCLDCALPTIQHCYPTNFVYVVEVLAEAFTPAVIDALSLTSKV